VTNQEEMDIASVRVHLLWLLQRVVLVDRKGLYPRVLEIIEQYATGEDLYPRSVEMSRSLRRSSLDTLS
jgi:hypothetical protein